MSHGAPDGWWWDDALIAAREAPGVGVAELRRRAEVAIVDLIRTVDTAAVGWPEWEAWAERWRSGEDRTAATGYGLWLERVAAGRAEIGGADGWRALCALEVAEFLSVADHCAMTAAQMALSLAAQAMPSEVDHAP